MRFFLLIALILAAVPAAIAERSPGGVVELPKDFGEVWLCAGQSNMQIGWFGFNRTPEEKLRVRNELAALDDLDIWLWNVNGGTWTWLTSANGGTCSAVGVSFAIRRAQMTGRSVAIVYVAAGGAPAESFLSRATMTSRRDDGSFRYPHLAAIANNPNPLETNADFPCVWCAREYPKRKGNVTEAAWWPVSRLHEGGIARIRDLPLTGVLWYQGESNASGLSIADPAQASAYMEETLMAVVEELRGTRKIPFLMMGLPLMNRPWAAYRAAQKKVCGKTGAIYLDTFGAGLGTADDVHPRNKIPFAVMAAAAADRALQPNPSDVVPVVDISGEAFRQTVVAAGTEEKYEGHPTTLLADDGRTMFCVWTTGHGGPCGQMARSDDGGRTWRRLDGQLPPKYAATHRNCPTLQKIAGPDGKVRYFVFSGLKNGGGKMGVLMSEDLGATWQVRPAVAEVFSGMPPTGFVQLKNGSCAIFGQRRTNPKVKTDRPSDDQDVWMSVSADGGLTWSPMRTVAHVANRNLCEPCCLRSPDGKSLALVMRENRHKGRSMMCFSHNEGESWTVPVDTPWALTGDRHEAVLLPDGRYVICFRDQAIGSPTRGQFVAWVGTWQDLVRRQPGECRIRLLNHHGLGKKFPGADWDTGYSGVELLPDGTVVCTTYSRHFADGRQSSVVSTRFKIEEIDARLRCSVGESRTLWKKGDGRVSHYRIPALCTAPNGDLIAACDARTWNGGDLDVYQPINTAVRRSCDGGRTWTDACLAWKWPWNENEQWSAADPSFVVDAQAGKVFMFVNVWEWKKRRGVYQFFVQESSDNGKTWSRPRDISQDVAFPQWPFGRTREEGGFIFITSGSGAQLSDGTLLHTLVRVGDGCALFGSADHGKTWRSFGTPVRGGDESKFAELSNGDWMINARLHKGGRKVHVSSDRGRTWRSAWRSDLLDPGCNGQLLRSGKVLLFSNCKSVRRANLTVRASLDDGQTWNDGVTVCRGSCAYSDMTVLPDGRIGILYERGAYDALDFVSVSLDTLIESGKKGK